LGALPERILAVAVGTVRGSGSGLLLLGRAIAGRRSWATFDALAQLDQAQLAARDLLGQPAALAGILDLEQFVGMREGVFAQRHELLDFRRGIGEPQAI